MAIQVAFVKVILIARPEKGVLKAIDCEYSLNRSEYFELIIDKMNLISLAVDRDLSMEIEV